MTFRIFKNIFIISALCFAAFAANAEPVLVVTGNAGTETVLSFGATPKVEVTGQGLVVTAGNKNVEFATNDVVKFAVENRDLDSSAKIEEGVVYFAIGDIVSAKGLKAGSSIEAYTLDGKKIGAAVADENGNAAIDLANAKGIIIIKTASKSFKIKK